MPVLYGLFIYMGVSALKGVQVNILVFVKTMPEEHHDIQCFEIHCYSIVLIVFHCFKNFLFSSSSLSIVS